MTGIVQRTFAAGTPPNRLLRFGLGVLALVMVLIALRNLLLLYPWGADLEIPLRAARRWLDGGQPYLAQSFTAGPGYDLPYLYPPYLLPLVAPLLWLPRGLVTVAWFGACLGAAAFACRRLAIPARWWPFLLVWPPFAEGLLGGNVQILLFAAFTALFWKDPGGGLSHSPTGTAPFHPIPYVPTSADRPAAADGLLGAAIGALKVSQIHPWLFLVRRRRRAAALGAGAIVGLTLLTLPLTGVQLWSDWLAQVARASDPNWDLIGAALTRYLPRPLGLAITAGSMLAVFAVPTRRAGAWVGLLAVIGSPSLHVFGLLFLLPAMLTIRREIALVAALLVATYTLEGWWLAIAMVGAALLASERWAWVQEPVPGSIPGR